MWAWFKDTCWLGDGDDLKPMFHWLINVVHNQSRVGWHRLFMIGSLTCFQV